ncbi:hypothetical protein DINM_005075 [Dirofilaria immitis]|nr:hypothetical protein [Dirofilaria immitis]
MFSILEFLNDVSCIEKIGECLTQILLLGRIVNIRKRQEVLTDHALKDDAAWTAFRVATSGRREGLVSAGCENSTIDRPFTTITLLKNAQKPHTKSLLLVIYMIFVRRDIDKELFTEYGGELINAGIMVAIIENIGKKMRDEYHVV